LLILANVRKHVQKILKKPKNGNENNANSKELQSSNADIVQLEIYFSLVQHTQAVCLPLQISEKQIIP